MNFGKNSCVGTFFLFFLNANKSIALLIFIGGLCLINISSAKPPSDTTSTSSVELGELTSKTRLMDNNDLINLLETSSREGVDFILPMQGGYGMTIVHGANVGFSALMGIATTINLMFVNDDSGLGKYFAMGGTSFLAAHNCYSLVRDLALFVSVPKGVETDNIEKYRGLLSPALSSLIYNKVPFNLLNVRVFFLPVAATASYYFALPDARSAGRAIETFAEGKNTIEEGSWNVTDSPPSVDDDSAENSLWYLLGASLNGLSTGTMIFVTILGIADDYIQSVKSIPGFLTLGALQLKEIPSIDFLQETGEVFDEMLRKTPYVTVNAALKALVNNNEKSFSLIPDLVHKDMSLFGDQLHKLFYGVLDKPALYNFFTINLPDVVSLGLYIGGAAAISSALSSVFTSYQSNDFAQSLGFTFDEDRQKITFNGTDVLTDDGIDTCSENPACVSAMDELADRKYSNWLGYLLQAVVVANAATQTFMTIPRAVYTFAVDVQSGNHHRGVSLLACVIPAFGIAALGQYGYLAHITGSATVEAISQSQAYDEQLGMTQYSGYTPEATAWITRIALAGMFIKGGTHLFTSLFLWILKSRCPTCIGNTVEGTGI